MIDLERRESVVLLRIDDGENRFHPDSIRAWNDALDAVERIAGPKALVTTGTGKFYSNGLDLEHMTSAGVDANAYVKSVLAIMARVLVFPAVTVAALNGHAFGAGAQLALAHDYRVMRTDRGYFCMPEVDMRAPLHPGMKAIIQARLPAQTAHEVIVTGTRYPAELARQRSIVDHAVGEAEVVGRAVEIAAGLAAKADPAMGRLKRDMYSGVLEALARDLSI
jgi:enoyl-CoA hydratase/carnithine racemase